MSGDTLDASPFLLADQQMRGNRARVLNKGGKSQTVFTPADYVRLERILGSTPTVVLEAFGLAQVSSLVEVEAYHRIKADRPDLAAAH